MCLCVYIYIYIYIKTSLYFCITVIKMVGKYTFFSYIFQIFVILQTLLSKATYCENNVIRNNENHVKKLKIIQMNKNILWWWTYMYILLKYIIIFLYYSKKVWGNTLYFHENNAIKMIIRCVMYFTFFVYTLSKKVIKSCPKTRTHFGFQF